MSLRSMLMAAAGASDTLPDSFTFPSRTGAEISTDYTASYLPVGYDESTWTVTNGQGSTDGSNYATSGKITKGQTFYIKATSSASYNQIITATVTFGGYVSVTYSITTRAVKVTPNQFTFTDVPSATNLSSTYTSNTATLTGMDPWQTVTVNASGSGEIDAGTSSLSGNWSSTSKTANTGAGGSIVLAARVTSNSTYSSTTSVKADLNGVNDTYSVTTKVADTAPDPFNFSDVIDAELTTSYTASVTPTGYDYAGWSVTNGEGSTNGSTWATSGSITSGQTFYVRRNSSSSYLTSVTADVNIGGTLDTWSIRTKVAPDTAPDTYTFSDVTNALTSTQYSQNLIPTGYNTATSWSVTGGQGSIDNANWSTSGTISPGQTFYVRATSSSAYTTKIDVSISIGGTLDTWSITTKDAPDTAPSAFNFSDVSDATPSQVYYTNVTPSGYNTATSWSVTGGQGSTDNSNWSTSGTISPGQTFYLKATASASYSSAVNVDVNIGGTLDTWYINTKVAPDTAPDNFNFTNVSSAELNSTQSTSVTPAGFNTATSWSVSGGTGSTDGVNYYGSGSISFGQTLYIRATSSASYNTQTSVTVNIGGTTSTWYITTKIDNIPDTFSFTNKTGQALGQPIDSAMITVAGLQPSSSITWSASGSTGAAVAVAAYPTTPTSFTTSGSTTTDSLGRLNVIARVTSSASQNQTTSVTVYIGTGSASFSVTTATLTGPSTYTVGTVSGVTPNSTQTTTFNLSGMTASVNYTATITSGTATLSTDNVTYASSRTFTTSGTGTATLYIRDTAPTGFNSSKSSTVSVNSVTATWTINTRAANLTPNQFTFTDITNATLSTTYTSNTATLTGMDTWQTVTVTATGSGTVDAGTSTLSGTFAASKSANTGSGGSIVVAAKLTSNSTYSSTTSVAIGVGTVTDTYSVATSAPPAGQAEWSSFSQTTTWTCPDGVTSVCIACIGGGGGGGTGDGISTGAGGGGGGGLAYVNNVTVVPGRSYQIRVGAGGVGASAGNLAGAGGDSYVYDSTAAVYLARAYGGAGGRRSYNSIAAGGSFDGTTGGTGGAGGKHVSGSCGGGGGAGGYGGNGGAGASSGTAATAGTYGGGGGAWAGNGAGGGGGTGIKVRGSGGAAGTGSSGAGGGGGSSGTSGTAGTNTMPYSPGTPGLAGGGAPAFYADPGRAGGIGAVRIIWGTGRSYPTNSADV